MRVLVIEDDVDLCEALVAELTVAGHEVICAREGALAIAELTRSYDALPAVILLDLMMPNRDGQRFRIRQLSDPRLASIPTLIITANDIDAATRSALEGVPVVRKPFASDVLIAAIDEVVRPPLEVKRCSCGRIYDWPTWGALQFVGEIDNGREVGERLELRQCVCKTTLAWQIGPHAVSVALLRIS
jgi:DNA-binding response OmpR family regulator